MARRRKKSHDEELGDVRTHLLDPFAEPGEIIRAPRRIDNEVGRETDADIVHAVLPTTLPLDQFYHEYTGLWRHVLDVRYKNKGKLKTYVQLGAALATRKVSVRALRKGMNMAKVFSKPETFLRAH